MRFNLVLLLGSTSFLVSAVPTGRPPEPWFSDVSSKRSIGVTSYDQARAGVRKLAASGQSFLSASGVFTVPDAINAKDLKVPGFSIEVVMGGAGCTEDRSKLVVGVNVLLTGSVVSYAGWASLRTQHALPLDFNITTGDIIQMGVYVDNSTTSAAFLYNISNDLLFVPIFTDAEHPVCQESVEWVLTGLASYSADITPIPYFDAVEFWDVEARDANSESVGLDRATKHDIVHNGTTLTHVSVSGSNITISHT